MRKNLFFNFKCIKLDSWGIFSFVNSIPSETHGAVGSEIIRVKSL